MTQEQVQWALISVTTAVILALIVLMIRIWAAKMRINQVLLAIIMALSGLFAALLTAAGEVDGTPWWYLPAALSAVLFVISMCVKPVTDAEIVHRMVEQEVQRYGPPPPAMPFDQLMLNKEPVVVNYDDFFLDHSLNSLVHQPPGQPVPCWIITPRWMEKASLLALIEAAGAHQCEYADQTQLMRAVD